MSGQPHPLAAPRRPHGGGLALAGDSGGERALIVDRAVELAEKHGEPRNVVEDLKQIRDEAKREAGK